MYWVGLPATGEPNTAQISWREELSILDSNPVSASKYILTGPRGDCKLKGMSYGGDPRYVRVTCPTCRAVLHPRVEKAGRRVRCPDCYSAVLVPQPSEAPAEPPPRDPGEYKVREAPGPPQATDDRSGDYFLTLCPTCQARLHPRRQQVGKRTRCPDCHTVFTIPPPPVEKKPKPLPPPKPYQMGETFARPPLEMELLTVQGRLEPEPPPPEVPRCWFVSGVLTFPWRASALPRWITLFLLLLPLELVLGVIWLVVQMDLSRLTTIVPLLAVPLAWLTLWSGSYAAACFLAIVQDTGSGNVDIHNWPEGDWRERVAPLAYLAMQLVFTAAGASTVASVAGLLAGATWAGVVMAMLAIFLFPFLLLSAMEADTPLWPYSPVMWRSLGHSFGAWLIVYLESIMLVAAIAGLIGLGIVWAPVAAALLVAPLLAALVFVLGRLYGRLAWRIGQHETGHRNKRRKKGRGKGTTPSVVAKVASS